MCAKAFKFCAYQMPQKATGHAFWKYEIKAIRKKSAAVISKIKLPPLSA